MKQRENKLNIPMALVFLNHSYEIVHIFLHIMKTIKRYPNIQSKQMHHLHLKDIFVLLIGLERKKQ